MLQNHWWKTCIKFLRKDLRIFAMQSSRNHIILACEEKVDPGVGWWQVPLQITGPNCPDDIPNHQKPHPKIVVEGQDPMGFQQAKILINHDISDIGQDESEAETSENGDYFAYNVSKRSSPAPDGDGCVDD